MILQLTLHRPSLASQTFSSCTAVWVKGFVYTLTELCSAVYFTWFVMVIMNKEIIDECGSLTHV